MDISIRIQKPFDDAPKSWEDAKVALDRDLGAARLLAERAFGPTKDREAWEQIQELLYAFNTSDLERIACPLSWAAVYQKAIRNEIVKTESRLISPETLDFSAGFSQDLALELLHHRAVTHRINTHPLLAHMNEHGLPKEVVRVFLDNYYINNRLFHLHIATLSLTSPIRKRNDLYANLYDELGCDDVEMAHPLLFLRNYNSIGLSEKIHPLHESLHLLNTKIAMTHLSSNFRKGFGGLGYIEITMPRQMRAILAGLGKSGIPEDDLIFWDLHIAIDERHGSTWFDEMRDTVLTEEDANLILNGGTRILDARAGFYDGVWRYAQQLAES